VEDVILFLRFYGSKHKVSHHQRPFENLFARFIPFPRSLDNPYLLLNFGKYHNVVCVCRKKLIKAQQYRSDCSISTAGVNQVTVGTAETPANMYARVAGVLYLIIIACGIFSEVFVRSTLIDPGDAAATAANIGASEWLFRLGFGCDAVMLLSDVAIAILFYELLKPVSKPLALTAAAFRLIQAAILGLNLLNYYVAWLLLNGFGYAAAFETDQLNALVMLFLEMHSHGYDLGLVFFAFSSLTLGFLIVKSGTFPGILGYGLIAAAAVYLAGSLIRFLFPAYVSLFTPIYTVPLVAELSFCLWLLVKGVRIQSA